MEEIFISKIVEAELVWYRQLGAQNFTIMILYNRVNATILWFH